MDNKTRGQVTEILRRATVGNDAALDHVLPIVYDELRDLAASYIRRERPGHTFGPTALAHEAYIKLRERPPVQWKDRAHLLAAAAQAMRRILVDHARARAAAKRGNGKAPVPLETALESALGPAVATVSWAELIDLDNALENLEKSYPRCAHVIELLYFGGFTAPEAGDLLGVAARTIERDWRFGRAWLLRALEGRSA